MCMITYLTVLHSRKNLKGGGSLGIKTGPHAFFYELALELCLASLSGTRDYLSAHQFPRVSSLLIDPAEELQLIHVPESVTRQLLGYPVLTDTLPSSSGS